MVAGDYRSPEDWKMNIWEFFRDLPLSLQDLTIKNCHRVFLGYLEEAPVKEVLPVEVKKIHVSRFQPILRTLPSRLLLLDSL